jgi:hypothetical protein
MTSLFILGVLLIPLGLSFLIIPEKLEEIGNKLNRWIITEHFFEVLNKPRYQERLFYRHHRVIGVLVMVCAVVCIYMMTFYTDIINVLDKVLQLTDSVFGQTILGTSYYLLIGANAIAFIVGLILIIRPSALKDIEKISNSWFETEQKLKVLDNTRDLPESMFPGNPRIFGTIILIGAIYIIISTKDILL